MACLLAALWHAHAVHADESESEVATIASVRATSSLDPRRPVTVRGRVTWVSRDAVVKDYAAVQDDTGGIWIDIRLAKERGSWRSEEAWQQIHPGMIIEVSGRRDEETFAPQIIPESLRPLGPADDIVFPEPVATTPERLFSGVDDSQRIRIEGIVQGFRDDGTRWLFSLYAGGRRFRVVVPRDDAVPDPLTLVDAVVSVVGVATTRYTTRGQLVMPSILVTRGCDFRRISPPPAEVLEPPLIPLERLARFATDVDLAHRIRTRGTVSYAADDRLFFLQSAAIGVRVEALVPEPLRPGDVVEVVGFLDRGGVLAGVTQAAGVVEAVVRVVGHEKQPTATVIQPARIFAVNRAAQRVGRLAEPGDYDGCLIECRARLVGIRQVVDGALLELSADETPLTAALSSRVLAALPRLESGSVLTIRGVVQFDLRPEGPSPSPWNLPLVERMSLLVPSADDVVVVSRPPLWTARRLLVAVGTLAGVLLVTLGWVALLRREVAVQSRRVAAEMTERQRAAIEFEVALQERSRLAANLHDTVLQTVTGIGYQLKACRRMKSSGAVDATREDSSIELAQRMVERAVDQLRGTVWAMRTMPLEGKSFPAALESLASRLQEGQAARITVHVAGVERDVPEAISGNLVLVAQEAVSNALRHAGPVAVDIMAVFDDASVAVVVHDDGSGFDVSLRPGATQGHFGIDGMCDRMKRLGGTVTVESQLGTGTTVTAVAPLGAAGRDLSSRPVSPADGVV